MRMPIPARALLQIAVAMVAFAALLFGAAGTIAWPGAWVFLIILAGYSCWISWILARHDPALLAERLKPPIQRGQQRWDKFLIVALLAAFLGWLPLMALDAKRYRWSAMPGALAWIGAGAMILSLYLCYFSFRANSYLATVVRIQKERGHHVITTGPYAVVRHPLYASALIFFPGVALLLGSWWGMIGGAVLIGLLALRTRLEDETLQRELDGYAEYAAMVKYRLIPGVW